MQINRGYYSRINSTDYNDAGMDFFARDWDNLIILDACRYDMFADAEPFGTPPQRVQSQAATTWEFLAANVGGARLYDTVYVTANPMYYRISNNNFPWGPENFHAEFHDEIHVWQEAGWDPEHETVLPETMAEYALNAANRYPNKRLFIHFIQPHYPFIGADLKVEQARPDTYDDRLGVWEKLTEMDTVSTALKQRVWQAYKNNLDRAIPSVKRLLERLSGRTVVASDHGNMVGDRAFPVPARVWGHPRGLYTDELTTVPWQSFSNGNKEIMSERPAADSESIEADIVRDRLEKLGYTD